MQVVKPVSLDVVIISVFDDVCWFIMFIMSSCFHLFVIGWMDVCIYVCYYHVFLLVWFGESFGWMLDVYYMPGLPLPEGDHCRLLVPGFDMANHDPRSHNDSPPRRFPPFVTFRPTG